MNTSSRRTNEPRPLEVEPSTAGATGGGDHGRVWLFRRGSPCSSVCQNAWQEWLENFMEEEGSVRDLHQDDLEEAFKAGWDGAVFVGPGGHDVISAH